MTSLGATPGPRAAAGAGTGPDLSAFALEFNGICADLARARDELRIGFLDEAAFADRILILFAHADSLQAILKSAGPAAWRVGTPLFPMERGVRYLIESLRENYVAIVARNGVSFIAADRALMAAVAWRSGAGATRPGVAAADGARP